MPSPRSDEALLVLCTCPDQASAEAIAADLVQSRLAACVNLLPGLTSVYRWEDQVEQASEVMLLIKTTAARVEALTNQVQQAHPYDLPEIIALPIADGLTPYLEWIHQCTREP
ncbi:MAG: divalent-cation tolerance protein CutA [Chromatiaceae bacterium]|nr:MAG: divalent-cation tolerance protein CutA [Chromatiaceae bacterium]